MNNFGQIENPEKYAPPKTGEQNTDFRRKRNVTEDNYRPHIKWGVDFGHYMENILDGKQHAITGDTLYYNRMIRLYQKECTTGKQPSQPLPRVIVTYLENRKDEILNWEVPDFRRLPNAERKRLKAERLAAKAKAKGENTELTPFKSESKTTDYQAKYNKLVGIEGTVLERFKLLVDSYLKGTPIKVSKSDGNMQTQLKQFIRKLQTKGYTINTYMPKQHEAYMISLKDKLINIPWNTVGPRPGGDTSVTRTPELNKQRSEKMKEYWAKKHANGDTKCKSDTLNIDPKQTPEARAKRVASLKEYWANKKLAKLETTPVTNTLDDLITDTLRIAESNGIYLERKTLESPQGCINCISDLLRANSKLSKEVDRLTLQTEQENVQLYSQQEITIKKLEATKAELEAEIEAYKKINSMNTATCNFEYFMQTIKISGCKQFHIEF